MDRRRRRIIDRSTKGYSPETRISKEETKARRAIEKSGIQRAAVIDVFTDIENAVFFYRVSTESLHQFPRLNQQRDELRVLEERAKKLEESLHCLSERSSRAITAGNPTVDPKSLLSCVQALATEAGRALIRLPVDMGGREKDSDFLDLVFGIAVSWKRNGGRGSGITKRYIGGYDGPLVRLVQAILRLEGLRAPPGLGRRLFEMKSRVQKGAAKPKDTYNDSDPEPLCKILRRDK